MTLHENKVLFKDAVFATASQKNLPDMYIEKDYWVTLALYTIFKSDIGSQVVFKGGTALSKCFQAIERFSEDIDLVVLRNEGELDSHLTKKIKPIGMSIEAILPEIEVEGITHKRGKIRKTAHSYNRIFDGDLGQIRDYIVLEATWLGHFEPYTTSSIQSFITEMMLNAGQKGLIEEYHLQPFDVRVLTIERTFCEKIMSLVRFSFTEQPIIDLNKKVRHIYDIHKLLENEATCVFFDSNRFDEMLLKVANDDIISFKNNNSWLSNHPVKAIIFSDITNTWHLIRETYNTTFKDLVFGKLPSENEILGTLQRVANRLRDITWTIRVDFDKKAIVKKLLSMNKRELSELIEELQTKV